VSVRAAGDIDVLQDINYYATVREFDGGLLELESGMGAINVSAQLKGSGGGLSRGGRTALLAGTDLNLSGQIDVTGGDFDGGAVTLSAGQDVFLNDSVQADATAGAGRGGTITVGAGRDIYITDSSLLTANGHTSADNFGGDGGTQLVSAGRNCVIGSAVIMSANGALPDGFGGSLTFESSGGMTLAGTFSAVGEGTQGAGGTISAEAIADLQIGPNSMLDATGGASGGAVELEGCGVTLTDGALVRNLGRVDGGGTNTLIGHAQIQVDAGAACLRLRVGRTGFGMVSGTAARGPRRDRSVLAG
jgi:hypothetical protein